MELLTLLDKFALLFEKWGYPIIFVSSLIETTPLGWAVPGGVILILAGYLSNGNIQFPLIPIIIFGTLGTWTAFLLAYILGSKTGMWLVKKLEQERNAQIAKNMLANNGGVILTTSMLANLTRFWISYIAGVEKYNLFKFNLYAFFASLSWVSMLVFLGYFVGYEKENLRKLTSSIGIIAWVLLAIALFVIYKSIKKEYKKFKEDEPTTEKI